MTSLFHSLEFYVVMVIVAAAVIGFAAMPQRRGAVREMLIEGILTFGGEPQSPAIEARVNDDCSLTIYRHGLEGVTASGAYSLAVKISGYDITIDERTMPGNHGGEMATGGRATITGLASERYHILYRSETTGRNAAFSLNIRQGNKISHELV